MEETEGTKEMKEMKTIGKLVAGTRHGNVGGNLIFSSRSDADSQRKSHCLTRLAGLTRLTGEMIGKMVCTWMVVVIVCSCFGGGCVSLPQEDASEFVAITDVVPDVILEIRYFGTYNFVGQRIDGYLAPTALLTRRAAEKLRAVSDDVGKQGYRLKIYDAYRPQKAVDHFVRWAADINDTQMKSCFYPDVDKRLLFKQEYIMEKSGHTRGSTVDLTLFDMATGKEVDMGGTFDWFGEESHPDFCGNPETGEYRPSASKRAITEQQFRNRMTLRKAMLKHGFKPIDSEWWHFTLKDEPFPDTYFTFPVRGL